MSEKVEVVIKFVGEHSRKGKYRAGSIQCLDKELAKKLVERKEAYYRESLPSEEKERVIAEIPANAAKLAEKRQEERQESDKSNVEEKAKNDSDAQKDHAAK